VLCKCNFVSVVICAPTLLLVVSFVLLYILTLFLCLFYEILFSLLPFGTRLHISLLLLFDNNGFVSAVNVHEVSGDMKNIKESILIICLFH
jgi:positive regulator of sigma E activity